MKTCLPFVASLLILCTSCPQAPKTMSPRYMAPPPAAPVYDVVLTPHGSTNKTLVAGKPTTLRFFIGPNDANSALDSDNSTVNPEVLSKRITLAVSMSCLACEDAAFQTQPITYDADIRASTEAQFHLMPKVDLGTNKSSQIIFDIVGNGHLVDHFVVTVNFDGSQAAQGDVTRAAALANLNTSLVDITFELSWRDSRVVFTCNPSSRLAADLQQKCEYGERSFATNLTDINEVNRLSADGYLKLRGIIDGYGGLAKVPPSSMPALTSTMYRVGATLYDRLFQTPDPDLKAVIQSIEAASSPAHPIRIEVLTQDVFVPWALLYPPKLPSAPIDLAAFWGSKFELAIVPPINRAANFLGMLDPSSVGQIRGASLFLRYHSAAAPNKDIPSDLGEDLSQFLSQQLGPSGFVDMTSSNDFTEVLSQNLDTIELIFSYTHASSGTEFSLAPDGSVIRASSTLGSSLLLGGTDSVKADDLDFLRIGSGYYLRKEPLVFMDACETGSAGIAPLTSFDFPLVWLNLGARGVLVTDAPIDAYVASNFAKAVLKSVLSGSDILSAIHDVRKSFIDVQDSLPLLYEYYGDPDAGLKRPSTSNH